MMDCMKHITVLLFMFFMIVFMIPNAFAENVPEWVKNTAGWWASDQIDDQSFLQGIQFLIKEGIMVIPSTETLGSSDTHAVPVWIKNNAGWWAENKISEEEFVNAIQYLVETNIIQFQSDADYEKTKNIEKYLLDWDTIVNDSKYAYDGSIKMQSDFFGYVDYIVRYDAASNIVYDNAEPSLLRASLWLYQITGQEKFLQNAGHVANIIEKNYLYDSGIIMNVHPISSTVKIGEKHTNQEILGNVAQLALIDSNYVQLTKTIADAVIKHEINHETELLYDWVTLEGEPIDRFMNMSYGGSVGLESLLLAYEVTSDIVYLDQVKRTILAYWELRDKETNLIPSKVNTDTGSIEDSFMQQYGAGIFLKVLLYYYYITDDADI